MTSSCLNQSRDDRKSKTRPRNKHQIIRQISIQSKQKHTLYTTRQAWRHTFTKSNWRLKGLSTMLTSADHFKKNTWPRWVATLTHDTVRWYWSADTPFWQLSIDHNIDVQHVGNMSFRMLPDELQSGNWTLVSLWCRRTGSVWSRDNQIFWDG